MKILDSIIKILPSRPVYAHCDIPCGIYDPHPAQMAAHTVLRMTQLIEDTRKEDKSDESISRMIHVKEEHAEIVKREVATIWSDYFKEENLPAGRQGSEKVPDLADHVWQTLKLASKAKQKVDAEVAKALLAHVQVFAEMFYQSKGMESVRVPSGYPTGGEIVTHK